MSRKNWMVAGQAVCFVSACALLVGWNVRSFLAAMLLGFGVIFYDEAYR